MKAVVSALIAALATGPVLAQDPGDDWDYGEDPSRGLAVAAVTFDSFGVAVRCMNGNFSLILSGLPEGTGERTLAVQLRDRPELEETWVSDEDSGTLFSVWPRHSAAALSLGGRLSIRVPDGDQVRRYVVDIPPSETAVTRVLHSCGHAIADLPVIDTWPGDLESQGMVWVRQPEVRFPSASYAFGLAAIRCEADGSGRLINCTAESEFPVGSGFGRSAVLGAHRTGRVRAADGASPEIAGRVLSFTVRYRMAN